MVGLGGGEEGGRDRKGGGWRREKGEREGGKEKDRGWGVKYGERKRQEGREEREGEGQKKRQREGTREKEREGEGERQRKREERQGGRKRRGRRGGERARGRDRDGGGGGVEGEEREGERERNGGGGGGERDGEFQLDVFTSSCLENSRKLDGSTLLQQVDIVWEYRSLGETAWRQLEGDDMRVAQPAPPRGCQLVVHRLTAQSRGPGDAAGRTYRCYPLVDGQSLRDRAGTYTPDSPDTGSPDAQGSPDADVSPGRRPCEQRTDLDSSLSESTLPAPVSSLIINASKVLVYAISPEWSTQPVTKQRAKTQPKQTPERAHTHTHTCTPIPPPPPTHTNFTPTSPSTP